MLTNLDMKPLQQHTQRRRHQTHIRRHARHDQLGLPRRTHGGCKFRGLPCVDDAGALDAFRVRFWRGLLDDVEEEALDVGFPFGGEASVSVGERDYWRAFVFKGRRCKGRGRGE